MKRITKILIANRGEIAIRVIKTCKKYGISTVAVYSESDKNSLHVSLADEAHFIGPSQAQQSYLVIDRIIDVAIKSKSDAIHPGYGFLSENSEFAKKCEEHGIIFIGPTSKAIQLMGSKIESKKLLHGREEIPLIPGTIEAISNFNEVKSTALKIGFPILLKASAGGGGKGMRIVRKEEELERAISEAQSEAFSSFGDSSLLLEKYFEHVKHIEVQIIGDIHGNVMHLFERECSVQRRHQKVIEEAPSNSISCNLKQRMQKAAVEIGKVIGYVSVGTVEFIVDQLSEEFYFLEVNTRLQVEHPVTEMITNLDLVLLQIEIAKGKSLMDLNVQNAKVNGHSMELRLYAEDPNNEFFPCTGKILLWKEFSHPCIRYDTGIQTGSEISVFYDPLISKIISFGENREQAIVLLIKALMETVILGLTTNKMFLLQVLNHPSFLDLSFTTHFIDQFFSTQTRTESHHKLLKESEREIFSISTVWNWIKKRNTLKYWRGVPSGFRNNRYSNQVRLFSFKDTSSSSSSSSSSIVEVAYRVLDNRNQTFPFFFSIKVGENCDYFKVELLSVSENEIICVIDGVRKKYYIADFDDNFYIHSNDAEFTVIKHSVLHSNTTSDSDTERDIIAEMPARILQINVKHGDVVKKGDILLVIESMKMQSRKNAPADGVVKLFVKESDLVEAGTLLITVDGQNKQ